MPRELTTVADDEAVVFDGSHVERFAGLAPGTRHELGGFEFTTLPRRGDLLATIATVNDVHFGEVVAGHIDGMDFEGVSSAPGAEPYPETMNRGAVAEIISKNPDLVVAKGDLTDRGLDVEYDRFLEVYGGAFGDRLLAVRGNHESYHGQTRGAEPFQERSVDGVIVVLIDTARDGVTHGDLTTDQLDQLDDLADRSDRPVLVMGHHPVWDRTREERRDDTFGLLPAATEALGAVFARRPALLGYFAGHTHRNRVVHLPDCGDRPFVEVAAVKEFPGTWAEYRVYDGLVLQVHRRISTPEALEWSERTRTMFGGGFEAYASGRLEDRCFAMWAGR